ncbi:Mur ligase family protein [Sciscionella marina]|uniref:Mur ligase family protein n=1 Tax=Sciscionella marina TaxID=508770 RepID=UPI0003798046|nr:Mur ligase family protein [Sciscionella marina]
MTATLERAQRSETGKPDMRRSIRTRFAVGAGRFVAWLSRIAGFGGHVIGGRIALLLHPGCLAELACGRRIVLVSGTNGKTTTTAMLTAALRAEGPVASNDTGANMLDGLTWVLATDPAPTVVVEIDELYLPIAVQRVHPVAVVLGNLSRDQLDRAGELRDTARRLRALADSFPALRIVANCEDPYVAFIAAAFPRVVWVSVGSGWDGDTGNCPACGHRLAKRSPLHWACARCRTERPDPEWRLTLEDPDTMLRTPEEQPVPLRPVLPGRVNEQNAAMAVAAARLLGVPVERAAAAANRVHDIAGRYRTIRTERHTARMILAKNPAGWAATLEILAANPAPVIISINANEADGRDTSWLYDVPFERLAGHTVLATGARAADLGVRLSYAGIAHGTEPDPLAALTALEPGPVYLVSDYSGFAELRRRTGDGSR